MGNIAKLCLFGGFWAASAAYGQIAGTSFNTSTLCINPAATVVRPFGHYSMAYNYKNSQSKLSQELSGISDVPWKEKLEIHRGEGIFAHAGKVLATEIYVSYDNVEKTTTLDQSGEMTENDQNANSQSNVNKAAFVNNMINLGVKLGKYFGLGVKYYQPTFRYKIDNEFEYSDDQTTSEVQNIRGRYTGVGGGALIRFSPAFSLGAFYISSRQNLKGTITFTDATGDEFSPEIFGDTPFTTKGGGLAYQIGTMRKDGKRVELGYSKMDAFVNGQTQPGEQIFAAAEMAVRGVAFGASVRLIRNAFMDNMRLVEGYIDPPPAENKFSPRFEYFLSLSSSKGHSLGVDGSYWSGSGKKQFQGAEQLVDTTTYTVGASYSYIF